VIVGGIWLDLVTPALAAHTSGPIIIDGQGGTVISGLKISSATGDCVTIVDSTSISVQNSEIGPCGTNNTQSNSRGIYIKNSIGINIFDSYIHVENLASGCCDTHDGVLVDGSSYVTIQGNAIAYGESNIQIGRAPSDHISVIGNFLLNPRGPYPRGQNLQSWPALGSNTNIIVSGNYALSSPDTTRYLYPENQEDSLDFGFTDGIIVVNNYLAGGQSPSGCGIMGDDSAGDVQILNNILSDTGQCGIGIASGTNYAVNGNKVLNLNAVRGGRNTAIYVWNQYATSCGPVSIFNNVADELRPDGYHSGYWDGNGSGTVTATNNTWGPAAYNLLYPMSETNPPPPISGTA
jgi:hypothetical protein